MGRQAKLRQMKKNGELPEKKTAVYNYTQAQFDMAIKAAVHEMKKELIKEIVAKTVNSYIIITAWTLHFMFGFGSTRLKRFFYKFYQNCDDLAFDGEDPSTIQSLAKDLQEDNIDVQQILSNKISEHETRDRRQMEKAMPKNSLHFKV